MTLYSSYIEIILVLIPLIISSIITISLSLWLNNKKNINKNKIVLITIFSFTLVFIILEIIKCILSITCFGEFRAGYWPLVLCSFFMYAGVIFYIGSLIKNKTLINWLYYFLLTLGIGLFVFMLIAPDFIISQKLLNTIWNWKFQLENSSEKSYYTCYFAFHGLIFHILYVQLSLFLLVTNTIKISFKNDWWKVLSMYMGTMFIIILIAYIYCWTKNIPLKEGPDWEMIITGGGLLKDAPVPIVSLIVTLLITFFYFLMFNLIYLYYYIFRKYYSSKKINVKNHNIVK